jgi:transcription elongation factor Elf1
MFKYNCPFCEAENEVEKEVWYDGDVVDDEVCSSCGEEVDVSASVNITIHVAKPASVDAE